MSGQRSRGGKPCSWGRRRLKYCVELVRDAVLASGPRHDYVGLEQIEPWTGRLAQAEGTAVVVDGVANRFQRGDVLFGKLRPYLAKVHLAREAGLCSSELLVLRPKALTARYLFYRLLSVEFIYLVDASTYGAKMPRASWDFIGNVEHDVPFPEEQEAIADFLDCKTALIDDLIAGHASGSPHDGKVLRMCELLREYRRGLILGAVTGKFDVRERR